MAAIPHISHTSEHALISGGELNFIKLGGGATETLIFLKPIASRRRFMNFFTSSRHTMAGEKNGFFGLDTRVYLFHRLLPSEIGIRTGSRF